MERQSKQNIKHAVQAFTLILKTCGSEQSSTLLEEANDMWATTPTEKLIQLRETLLALDLKESNCHEELEQNRIQLIKMIDNILLKSNYPIPWNIIRHLRNLWNKLLY